MQNLQKDSHLQSGRYKILSTLGQGGFGITYLALQTGLERKVAIKEFFMKDLCNRDEATSHVSVGSNGSIDMVERFKGKFLKEARNIARFNHPNIIRILDVFEENGTAYYVMEYAEGGALAEKVKKCGALPESEAVRYILQIADALAYIHEQKMNHLDIKPANIMLNEKDDAILIDFGLSKQYDAVTGSQTSTTPVGISEGYAPMEQYKQGGVGDFSPETDIYALGATLFKLLTGVTPPSASDVNEDGVPVDELKAKGVSQSIIDTICKAMEGRKKDRIKQVDDFIKYLNPVNNTEVAPDFKQEETGKGPTGENTENKDEEDTKIVAEPQPSPQGKKVKKSKRNRTTRKIRSLIRKNIGIIFGTLCFIAVAIIIVFTYQPYTCDECNATFDNDIKFKDHKNNIHNPKTCLFCDKTFTGEISLNAHMDNEHHFVCDECGPDVWFVYKESLNAHKKEKKNDGSYHKRK